jgi:Tumour protein D52 family
MSVETDGRDELQAELDRREAEILRLRDLLIAKDTELGEVKGQLAELENITRGLMTFAHRVQSKAPGLFRIALGIARRARRLLRRFGV